MADTKTSDETAAGALTGAELVRIVQSGANRRTTAGTIALLAAVGVDSTYVYAAPVSGGTVVMIAGQRRAVLNPAGTLATLTVQLPPTPVDGQLAGAASTKIVTALSITAPGGASVAGGLTSLSVGGAFDMIYRATDTTWYPAP